MNDADSVIATMEKMDEVAREHGERMLRILRDHGTACWRLGFVGGVAAGITLMLMVELIFG